MEHITVSPEKVRMGGNIIDKKEIDDYESDDADLSVTTEVINLEEENVFLVSTEMVPASVGLTASRTIISPITVPHSSLLRATVHDAYDNPIVGVTVSFYNEDTLLGNVVTDEEGDAGFTYYASNVGDMNVTAVVEEVTSNVVIIEDCYLADTGEWNQVRDYEKGILTGSPSLQIDYDDREKEYLVYNRGTGAGMLYWDDIIEEPVIIEADLEISLFSPPIGVGVYVDDGDGFGIGVRKSYAFGWEFLNGVLTNLYGTDQQINYNYSAHIQVIINGTYLTVTYTNQSTGAVIFSTSCTIDEELLSDSKFGIMVGEYEQSSTGPAIFDNFIVKPYIPEPSPVDTVTLAADKNVLSAYDSETATLTATATDSESAPVTGETVTFKCDGTSIGTATTDSSGVATLSYSATGAGDVTFTAEAGSVTSTDLLISDCKYADIGDTDKSANYTSRYLEGSGTATITHNSTDYTITNGSNGAKAMVLADLSLTDFTMEADFQPGTGCIGISCSTQNKYGDVYSVEADLDHMNGWRYTNGSFSTPLGYSNPFSHTLTGYNTHLKIIKQGDSLTVQAYDNTDNTQVYTKTITLPTHLSGAVNPGIGIGIDGNKTGSFKNLKIY